MKDAMPVEILVCVLCRPAGVSRDEPRAGMVLFEAVQVAAFHEGPEFIVLPVQCMSSCKRSCAAALQSANKTIYLFGDLPATQACAEDILTCAKLYRSSPGGVMPRESRPKLLQEGILARIPALVLPVEPKRALPA